ncbi:MAG: AMP-binding protein [Janthinobacterium lividum]
MHAPNAVQSPYQAFVHAAARHADLPFLFVPASTVSRYQPGPTVGDVAGDGSLTLPYAQMLALIDAQKDRYLTAGYGRGCRVALLLENRPEFFVHFFALNALGASIVPLNRDAPAHELQFVAQHSAVSLAIGLGPTLALLQNALGDRVAILDAAHLPALPARRDPPAAPDGNHTARAPSTRDECAILYTSGTTGQPKGCILDNGYFLSIGTMYVNQGGHCALRPGRERLITPLPLFHMNALACSTMAMVLTGGCVIQLDRFHPRSWWSDVVESGATIIHYLGVMPAILLSLDPAGDPMPATAGYAVNRDDGNSDDGNSDNGGSRKAHAVCFGYGANVDPRHHHHFEARFGFPLIEAWAMTETGGAVVIAASHEPRHVGQRCFGRAGRGVALRLVDDQGRDVGDSVPGHLLVRRDGEHARQGFFRGYLNDPAATDAAWRDDWFVTGDIVRRDAQGNLFFVDRSKNIIRRSGENIAALEVEACLLEHDAVQQTAVIAAPDALRDEEVLACVVAAPGATRDQATAIALQRWCLERLAYYKAPGYIAFVDALPTTSTNKVQKMRLAAFAQNPLDTPACFDLRSTKKRA